MSANSGYYTTEKKQNINAKRRIIMKFKNLIAKSAIAYLLLLTSSAAMAVGCEGGIIRDTIVDSVVINGQPCFIIGVRVLGRVEVINSPSFVMIENDVGGRLRVRNSGLVGIVDTRVTNGNFVVLTSDLVAVKDNNVRDGSMRINRNINATVTRNDAQLNMVCINNTVLDASFNHADRGEENCNDRF